MNLHLPRRVRRKLDDRKLLAYFDYLLEQRDAQWAWQQSRTERWPPDLPAGVDGFPIGGKTR